MHRLAGLDLLRGIAALLVAAMHIEQIHLATDHLVMGYLAVDMFFMLSGYVMARTYETRLATGMGVRRFMGLRIRRLWAPVALGTCIGLVYQAGLPGADSLLFGFFMAICFLPWPGPGGFVFAFNIPAWSILFELLANLAHVVGLRRLGRWWLVALATLGLAPLAWLFLQWGIFVSASYSFTLLPNVARVLVPYVLGIAIWRFAGDQPRLPAWVAAVGVLAVVPAWFFIPRLAFDILFMALACPLLILWGLRLRLGQAAPLAFWLGSISFPLYAVHYPLAQLAKFHGLSPLAAFGLSLGLAAVLALPLANRPWTRRAEPLAA